MQKAALIAPVTALAVVSTGPRSSATVYAARGNELLTFTRSTLNASHTLTVFDHHNVHGINACQDARGGELVLVHGDKAVALCCTHAATSETEVRCRLRRLDDLVLATCWATVGGCEQLFVGYAHNFLDVFAVKAEVVSGRAAPRLLRRVTAQDNCCLFSMSIVPEATRVVVVGGTAFGPIYLWASHEEELRSDPSSHMCIEGHEGVVFRALWSEDRSLLASVSDDRSVRLWDMREGDTRGHQLFVGWGHISRVWDVSFLPARTGDRHVILATSSEDGTVMLWRARKCMEAQGTLGTAVLPTGVSAEVKEAKEAKEVKNKSVGGCCVHTFRGHYGDVWRTLPAWGSAGQALLLSGGNDGALKVWDASQWTSQLGQGQEPQAQPDSGRRRAQIPTWPSGCAAITGTSNARSGGVAGLSFSPCATWLLVGLIDGGLWHVTTRLAAGSEVEQEWTWTALWSSESKVSSMSVLYSLKAGAERAIVSLAHPRGVATLLVVALNTSSVCFEKQFQAHSLNTVGCWLLSADQYMLGDGHALAAHLITSSVKGQFKVWKVLVSADSGGNVATGETSVELLLEAVTGKAKEIVTSVAILARDASTAPGTAAVATVVTGDIRGSISVHALRLEGEVWAEGTEPAHPVQFLHRVHAGEPISCLTPLPGGRSFASGGNDGNIAFYQRTEGPASGPFKCANVFSALPIRAPQFLQAPPEGLASNEADPEELFLGGYYGEAFIVHDMKRSYQLLNVDGGSWKRKSAFALFYGAETGPGQGAVSVPGVLFVSAVPTSSGDKGKGKGTELEWYRKQPLEWSLLGEAMRAAGTSHLGRVSYAGAYIGTHLATGGEEGRLQLLGAVCPASGRRPLLQEAALPHFFSIKALASAGAGDGCRGVLVGGGSRLGYSVWAWCERTDLPLLLLAAGSVWPNAPQDHRILCAAVSKLPPTSGATDSFCIALCDSRGVAALSVVGCTQNENQISTGSGEGALPHNKTIPALYFEEELEACAGAAVLDCKLIVAEGTVLAVFGSTSGLVSVWQLGGRFSALGGPSRLLASFQAHSMGANAVDAFLAPNAAPGAVTLLVSSGGDDQAITLGCGVLTRAADGYFAWSTQFRTRHFSSATSSSVQGLRWAGRRDEGPEGGWGLVSLSADQRLHRWAVTASPEHWNELGTGEDTGSSCGATSGAATQYNISCPAYDAADGEGRSAGLGLRWREGSVSNVGDPQALVLGEGRVAVVGQGTQEVVL